MSRYLQYSEPEDPHQSPFSLRIHVKALDHRKWKAEGYDVQGNIQHGSRCDESPVIEIVVDGKVEPALHRPRGKDLGLFDVR